MEHQPREPYPANALEQGACAASKDASGKSVSNFQCLQEADMAMLRASSEHVRKWTVETILSDWTAYCAASREIRWKMDAAMNTETRLLFSMLTD